jgi:hypothetical protein
VEDHLASAAACGVPGGHLAVVGHAAFGQGDHADPEVEAGLVLLLEAFQEGHLGHREVGSQIP